MSIAELDEIKLRLNEISSDLPKADAAQPVTLSLRIEMANALNSLGDVKRAGVLCGEVLQASPNHKQAHMIRINAVLRDKDFPQGLKLIDRAISKLGDDAGLQLKKADALRGMGRFDEAISLLQRLQLERPEDCNLKLNLARSLMSSGKYNAADAVFLEVLDQDPKNRGAWMGRVKVALTVGDHHSAASRAERALEYLPKDEALTARAGQAMANIGRIVEAIKLLRETIAASSVPSVDIQLTFASLLQQAGELTEAEDIIQMIIAEQPENAAALSQYVALALTRGDVDAALIRCNDAIKKLPEDVRLIRRKAMLQQKTGRLVDAADTLRTLQQEQPYDVVARLQLARTLMANQDLDAAEVIFVEVLKKHPSNRPALLGRVDIAEARGDLELAMALLEPEHQAP